MLKMFFFFTREDYFMICLDLQEHQYLSLTLVLGKVHLLEDFRSLLHHQGLFVSVGRDVAVMLELNERTC